MNIKMKKILFVAALFISGFSHAQWDTIAHFNQTIQNLKTFNGELFIVGNFTKCNDLDCYWSATYDGSNMTRHLAPIGGGGLLMLDYLNDEIYGVGSMIFGSTTGVAQYDGYTWTNGGGTSNSHGVIYSDNDHLYVVDHDGLIRRKASDSGFETFYDFNEEGDVSCIMGYNNNLIIAGEFDTINGIPANNIALWDGANWQNLSEGITGDIECMQVFNEELYVAGRISNAGGLSIEKIAKWNGTEWSTVGLATSEVAYERITDMVVFNNTLIVVGDFSQIAGVTTNDIAVWNSTTWASLDLSHNYSYITSIEIFNNEIYIALFGSWLGKLLKYTGDSKVDTNNESIMVNVYPNPAIKSINIKIDPRFVTNYQIDIADTYGKIVAKNILTEEDDFNQSFDCSNLSRGTYFVIIKDRTTHVVVKSEKIILTQ